MTLNQAKADAREVSARNGWPMYVFYNNATRVYVTSINANNDRWYTHLTFVCGIGEGAER